MREKKSFVTLPQIVDITDDTVSLSRSDFAWQAFPAKPNIFCKGGVFYQPLKAYFVQNDLSYFSESSLKEKKSFLTLPPD